MSLSGDGVVVYLRQEGRGIGLAQKLAAYNLQDLGNDTYEANLLLNHPADARRFVLLLSRLTTEPSGNDAFITKHLQSVFQ
jgi:GTP cyclohydrolase II